MELERLQQGEPRTIALSCGPQGWLEIGIGGQWSYLWLNRWEQGECELYFALSRPVPEDRQPSFHCSFTMDTQGRQLSLPDWALFPAEVVIGMALYYHSHGQLPEDVLLKRVEW